MENTQEGSRNVSVIIVSKNIKFAYVSSKRQRPDAEDRLLDAIYKTCLKH